jgi:hypothetical protein
MAAVSLETFKIIEMPMKLDSSIIGFVSLNSKKYLTQECTCVTWKTNHLCKCHITLFFNEVVAMLIFFAPWTVLARRQFQNSYPDPLIRRCR